MGEKRDADVPPSGSSASSNSPRAPECLAPMDFSTFVLSLGSSAMVNLGKLSAPGETGPEPDLPAAKQIIEILGILEEKTRGNLSESESSLLASLLYDLRIQYLDAERGAHAG